MSDAVTVDPNAPKPPQATVTIPRWRLVDLHHLAQTDGDSDLIAWIEIALGYREAPDASQPPVTTQEAVAWRKVCIGPPAAVGGKSPWFDCDFPDSAEIAKYRSNGYAIEFAYASPSPVAEQHGLSSSGSGEGVQCDREGGGSVPLGYRMVMLPDDWRTVPRDLTEPMRKAIIHAVKLRFRKWADEAWHGALGNCPAVPSHPGGGANDRGSD